MGGLFSRGGDYAANDLIFNVQPKLMRHRAELDSHARKLEEKIRVKTLEMHAKCDAGDTAAMYHLAQTISMLENFLRNNRAEYVKVETYIEQVVELIRAYQSSELTASLSTNIARLGLDPKMDHELNAKKAAVITYASSITAAVSGIGAGTQMTWFRDGAADDENTDGIEMRAQEIMDDVLRKAADRTARECYGLQV